MQRLVTKCCWSLAKQVYNEGGPDHTYCIACNAHDPHLEWVEECDQCKLPARFCECP